MPGSTHLGPSELSSYPSTPSTPTPAIAPPPSPTPPLHQLPALYMPRLVSNAFFFFIISLLILIAKGCLAIIIRITRVGPVVTLNWNGDKSVGSSLGPRWVLPGISSPHFLYYYQYAKAGTKQIHAAQCQGPPHTHTSGVGIATSHYSLECLLEHLLVFSQSVARSRKCNGNWHKEGKGFVGLCAWKV